jgi:hypothetical protein
MKIAAPGETVHQQQRSAKTRVKRSYNESSDKCSLSYVTLAMKLNYSDFEVGNERIS